MKTTKLFRKYLNGKKASKIVSYNTKMLDDMLRLQADERGTIPLTDVLYIEQHDMEDLYKELLELQKIVIPFTSKKGGWNFCVNDVEEHELDKPLNFPKVWEGVEDIDTDDEFSGGLFVTYGKTKTIEEVLNPTSDCLIDKEIVEYMRCFDITFESLVYLANSYKLGSGQRINHWMKRLWEDYESARLYLNSINHNGTDAHKRKLWVLDTTTFNDYGLSPYYGDELFPIRLKNTIVYNRDTLSSLVEQGSGSPDTPFQLLSLNKLYREYIDGSSLSTVENKIVNDWYSASAYEYTHIIDKKRFNKIIEKYVKKKVY